MQLNSIEEIVADIRAGKMVIIMDDEDRENEGDLLMAAEHVTPEAINFMARHGRGLICMPISRKRCEQLRLPMMVTEAGGRHGTPFTVSIEAAEGVTTGISAHDRAKTVLAAVKADATPEDVVQPGHIFPLMAQPGGVLTRAGHTEAGVDFARLAGCEPAAVIVEILNEDGTMARRPDLEKFAAEHDLKIGTIADLIQYRMQNEHSVERLLETKVDTEYGEFTMISYEDTIDRTMHIAMVRGDISGDDPVLVRVHLRNTLNDVLSVEHESFGWPLRSALKRVAEEERGVVIVLRKPESASDLADHISALSGQSVFPPMGDDPTSPVLRTYGLGAQILQDLGVHKMKVLGRPRKMHGISGFGLEVTEYEEPHD